ncbi:MAG: mechanosensitive ion channel [Gemmatimonadota bacterium]|nr:MAG: mechanosensitive ion channel [Gemmatimonadota bacterium]
MTTTRYRPVAAVALALLLAAMHHGTLAAQERPPTPPPPTDTAAAPVGPLAIQATDIPQRAEQATAALRRIRSDLTADTAIGAIDSVFRAASAVMRPRAERLRDADLENVLMRDLEDLETEWLNYRAGLEGWRRELEQRTQALTAKRERLEGLRTAWQLTRDSASAMELPAALRQRVAALLEEINELDAQVRRPRSRQLTLQNQIADEAIVVAELLTSIEAAKAGARRRLLSAGDPPLWQLGAVREAGAERATPTLTERLATVEDYYRTHAQRLWAHLLLILIFTAAMAALARRTRRGGIDADAVARAGYFIQRPFATGLLLSVLFNRLLHPLAPSVFYDAVAVVALLALLRLVPGLVPSRLVRPVYGLIAAYLTYDLFDLFVGRPWILRVVILVIAAAVLAGVVRLLRAERRDPEARATRWERAFVVLLPIGAALLGVSVLANIVGYTALAELLVEGTVSAALIGLIVLLGVRSADAAIYAGLATQTAQSSRVLRDHGDRLAQRAASLVHVGGALLWSVFVFRRFRMWDEVRGATGAILTEEVSIGSWQISILDIAVFLIALWLGLMIARGVRVVLRDDVLTRVALPRGMPETISTSVYYVVLVFAFFIAAGAAGFDLTKFTILAGALGVGIGFGLQNIVNNFISGLILLFERPIQIGDTIEIENLVGSVKQIGIRASVVRTFAGAEVIVPNGDLISGRVINWTLSDRLRRIEIAVGVAYGTDPQRVMDILLEQAKSHADTLEHPEPYVLFMGFGESSLDFQLRFWTAEYDRWIFIESEVKVAVNSALKEAGIEIPFPQRDLHLRSVDAAAGEALAPGRGAAVVKRSTPEKKE